MTISEQSSGGKDSVDSLCAEYLEVPLNASPSFPHRDPNKILLKNLHLPLAKKRVLWYDIR